ncbi:MAG: hypothetical protein V4560_03185 [Bacteroidota bacterium]
MSEDTIAEIKSLFNKSNLTNAIDIDALMPLSLTKAQSDPHLNHFFSLDEDGPFSEILKRGTQSLRTGFYKIITKPYYRTTIFPANFAADVYYYGDNDVLYKYHANIGPLTNTSTQPFPINDKYRNTPIPILDKFLRDKQTFGGNQDYMIAKKNFYDSVFAEERIILVIESIWDPAYPTINRRKQVKWAFIDF